MLLDTRFPDYYLFQSSSKITFLDFEIVDIVDNSFKSNLFYLSILWLQLILSISILKQN